MVEDEGEEEGEDEEEDEGEEEGDRIEEEDQAQIIMLHPVTATLLQCLESEMRCVFIAIALEKCWIHSFTLTYLCTVEPM